MIDYIHRRGNACGNLAFRVRDDLVYGMRVTPRHVTLPDGSHPTPGTQVRCGSCGEPLPIGYAFPSPRDGSNEVDV